jgi:hypothetical protein
MMHACRRWLHAADVFAIIMRPQISLRHACSLAQRSGARDTALLGGQLQWHREQLAATQAALAGQERSARSAGDRAREWQRRAARAERDNKQLQELLRRAPLLDSSCPSDRRMPLCAVWKEFF